MDLGKIGKKGLGNLGSGILGNHEKGGILYTLPLERSFLFEGYLLGDFLKGYP